MKPGSTQQLEKLPPTNNCVYEMPLVLHSQASRHTLLHFIAALFGSYIGQILVQCLPMILWPAFLVASMFWPLVLILFAWKFVRHYSLVCTGALPVSERQQVRRRVTADTVMTLLFSPLLLPWLLWEMLANFPELTRAWRSYLNYNLESTWTAGVLVNPGGSHTNRVCWFHLTIWYFAACALLTCWPSIFDAGRFWIVAFGIGPSAVVMLVASLLIAPSLKTLKEARCAE